MKETVSGWLAFRFDNVGRVKARHRAKVKIGIWLNGHSLCLAKHRLVCNENVK